MKGKNILALAVLCLVAGLILFSMGKTFYDNYFTAFFWNEAPATVTDSRIEVRGASMRHVYAAVVTYTYAVAGHSYDGVYDSDFSNTGFSKDAAQEKMQKYPRGAAIIVRVDPHDPSRSALPETVTKSTYFFLGMITVFLLLVLFGRKNFLYTRANVIIGTGKTEKKNKM